MGHKFPCSGASCRVWSWCWRCWRLSVSFSPFAFLFPSFHAFFGTRVSVPPCSQPKLCLCHLCQLGICPFVWVELGAGGWPRPSWAGSLHTLKAEHWARAGPGVCTEQGHLSSCVPSQSCLHRPVTCHMAGASIWGGLGWAPSWGIAAPTRVCCLPHSDPQPSMCVNGSTVRLGL